MGPKHITRPALSLKTKGDPTLPRIDLVPGCIQHTAGAEHDHGGVSARHTGKGHLRPFHLDQGITTVDDQARLHLHQGQGGHGGGHARAVHLLSCNSSM